MSLGKFISLEGGEGTGKSTQAIRLKDKLEELGYEVVLTREPGGSPKAEAIREVLLSGEAKPLGPLAETLLLYAARDDHLRKTIEPALAAGAWVVCDRFSDSTRAYQGAAGGVDKGHIETFERIVVGRNKPDLTLILDLPAATGLKRASTRRKASHSTESADRFESMDLEFHDKLRSAFLKIAEEDPERCVIIDAEGDRNAVADAIWQVVDERLNP